MAEATAAAKESKAEKAERLKQAKNPWNALDEIRSFARLGRHAIPEEWTSTYFKWWGIYTQGDGHGALGKPSPYFMLRVGLPNGQLTAAQARLIATLAEQHARGSAAITTRQTLQLHWIAIESIPAILDGLATVGLTSRGTSGDALRGITGCPLAGMLPGEILNTSPLISSIARELTANPAFYNLPRKIKVSVTACPSWCSHPQFNDLALTAVLRGAEPGFSLRVGGGLAREPHPAVRLNAFVRPSQALDVVRSVMELFRRQDSLRQKREQARLKHLFLKQGWTPKQFLDEIESILGYPLSPAVPEHIPHTSRDHLGIHPQQQTGLDFLGVTIPAGELTSHQLLAIADLSESFATGHIRLTTSQNLILPNVPRTLSSRLATELAQLGLFVETSPFSRGTVACTGTQFCKLGIAETKHFTRGLIHHLEEQLPGFTHHLKINVTGCGNGCAHHHFADIGLEGKKIRLQGEMHDGFSFRIGGRTGHHAEPSRLVGFQCTATAAPAAIERLLRGFIHHRRGCETLHDFLARNSDEFLRSLLAEKPTTSSPA